MRLSIVKLILVFGREATEDIAYSYSSKSLEAEKGFYSSFDWAFCLVAKTTAKRLRNVSSYLEAASDTRAILKTRIGC
jgi:hypothetical protein